MEHGESLKRRHYLPVLGREPLYDDKVFVLFVVAVSGNQSSSTKLSTKLSSTVRLYGQGRALELAWIEAIIAKWNAKIAFEWVRSVIVRSTLTNFDLIGD